MIARTRKEQLLDAIVNDTVVDFVPVSREELFLAKIAGMDVETPIPVLRKELLYQSIIDGTLPEVIPVTRIERFIALVAGVETDSLVPRKREEFWWADIFEHREELHTVTGSIVTFIAKRATPLRQFATTIEPVQDLHGYDKPWPAGGGKNLLWLNNGVFKTGGFTNTTPRELTGIGTWVGMSASNYLAPNNIVSYTIGDNSLTVESKANGYGIGIECKLTAGQQYTLSWVGTNAFVGISFYDGDGLPLSYVTSGVSPKTFTVPESTANAIIILRGDAANVTGEFSNVQLEEGQTATAYSPYANICPITGFTEANIYVSPTQDQQDATVYNVDWTSEAGTVYGGTLDVTTGKLTVNKVALMFNGSEGWASVTANGHTRQRVNSVLIGIKQITGGGQTPNLISDRYPTKTPNATYAGTVGITNQQNSEDLYIMDNQYDYVDSASDYKTWLSTNNLKVVYELAEPVTYQLTPTQVTTLIGENNVWSDVGDVTVTFKGTPVTAVPTRRAALVIPAPDSETESEPEER